MATVICAITKGDKPLDIDIMFDGKPIQSESGVAITKSGKRGRQLTIESVEAKHAGEYTCVASNNAGSVSKSAVLAVNGIT